MMNDRIEELTDQLVARLHEEYLPDLVQAKIADDLRERLQEDDLAHYVASRLDEPVDRTLEGLVLCFDPYRQRVELVYKH